MHSLLCDFCSSDRRFARGLVGSPHPASFRFAVTCNTLAFGYILPTTGRIQDFHPLETCAARRTMKRTVRIERFFYFTADIAIISRKGCGPNLNFKELWPTTDFIVRARLQFKSHLARRCSRFAGQILIYEDFGPQVSLLCGQNQIMKSKWPATQGENAGQITA